MINRRKLAGRCFCGHVRFEISADPLFACHCHCESCQRAAGAPFVSWATFDIENFDITSGAITEHQSSQGVQRGHCALCGTTLTYACSDRLGQIDIAVTSLDDSSAVKPQAHIWVEDKATWLSIDDELPKYRTTVSAGDLA